MFREPQCAHLGLSACICLTPIALPRPQEPGARPGIPCLRGRPLLLSPARCYAGPRPERGAPAGGRRTAGAAAAHGRHARCTVSWRLIPAFPVGGKQPPSAAPPRQILHRTAGLSSLAPSLFGRMHSAACALRAALCAACLARQAPTSHLLPGPTVHCWHLPISSPRMPQRVIFFRPLAFSADEFCQAAASPGARMPRGPLSHATVKPCAAPAL